MEYLGFQMEFDPNIRVTKYNQDADSEIINDNINNSLPLRLDVFGVCHLRFSLEETTKNPRNFFAMIDRRY